MKDPNRHQQEVGRLTVELQSIRHALVDSCPPLGYMETVGSRHGEVPIHPWVGEGREVKDMLYRQAEIINRLVELAIYKDKNKR